MNVQYGFRLAAPLLVLAVVSVGVVAEAPPAFALQGAPDAAAVSKLVSEGKSYTEAVNLLRSMAAAVEMEKAAVTAGAGSATANVAAHMVKTPAGWVAVRAATSATPWGVAALIGTLMSNHSAKQLAKAIYGDGTGTQPGDGSTMRFQYSENQRWVWVTPSWQGANLATTSGGCYQGTNTLWWTVLQVGQDPGIIGCAGDVVTWNPRSGENYNTLDAQSAPIVATANGMNKYAIPGTAVKFYRNGRVQAANSGWAQFKINEAMLPAIGPQLKADALEGTDWGDLAKVSTTPAHGGEYEVVPASTIGPGSTVIAPEGPQAVPKKRIWGQPAEEGPGVEADPAPEPSPSPSGSPVVDPTPTPTPTATPTGTPTTTPDPNDKEYSNTVPVPKTAPSATPNFITHFFDVVGTKFPFDMLAGVDITGDEHPLCYKAFEGVKTKATITIAEDGTATQTWTQDGDLVEREHCWMDALRGPLNLLVWAGFIGIVILGIINI